MIARYCVRFAMEWSPPPPIELRIRGQLENVLLLTDSEQEAKTAACRHSRLAPGTAVDVLDLDTGEQWRALRGELGAFAAPGE